MNQSFEVIITQDQNKSYQQNAQELQLTKDRLKHLQDEVQITKTEHDSALKRSENKIKELSLNSLRLSKKVLSLEDNYQKLQDNYFKREKDLLEKLEKVLCVKGQFDRKVQILEKEARAKTELEKQLKFEKNKTKQLEEEVTLVKKRLDQVYSQQSQIKQDSQRLTLSYQKTIEDLNNSHRLEVQHLNEKIEKSMTLIKELEGKINQLKEVEQSQFDQITSFHHKAYIQAQQYSLKIQEIESEKSQLHENQKELRREIAEIIAQNECNIDQLNKKVGLQQEEEQILKEEIKLAQEEIEHLKNKIADNKRENEVLIVSYQQQIRSLNQQKQQSAMFCSRLKQQIEALVLKNNNKRQKIKQLSFRILDLQVKKNNAQSQKEYFLSQIDKLQQKTEKQINQNTALCNQLAEKINDCEFIKVKCEETIQEQKRLAVQLEAAQSQMARLSKQLADKDAKQSQNMWAHFQLNLIAKGQSAKKDIQDQYIEKEVLKIEFQSIYSEYKLKIQQQNKQFTAWFWHWIGQYY